VAAAQFLLLLPFFFTCSDGGGSLSRSRAAWRNFEPASGSEEAAGALSSSTFEVSFFLGLVDLLKSTTFPSLSVITKGFFFLGATACCCGTGCGCTAGACWGG